MKNTLVVVCGPTAVGKTGVAILLAKIFGAEIISADSRQFYHEMKIGTAVPVDAELNEVHHHFVGHLSIGDYYNISKFEQDAVNWLTQWYENHPIALMVGGSGLYIDAVCKGIDELPDPDENLRTELRERVQCEGLESLLSQLKTLDPVYYSRVDQKNPNRILRALEVCLIAGIPYSELRRNQPKPRNFRILKIGLTLPRNELIIKINERVDRMIMNGLVAEAESLLKYRNLNALNTVGYKEIFGYFDGRCSLPEAIEKIKINSRKYAKRQLTWFRKDNEIHWFHPEDIEGIVNWISGNDPGCIK